MRWQPVLTPAIVAVCAATLAAPVPAAVYMTVEQAQQSMFPGASLKKIDFALTSEQRQSLRSRSGVYEPFNEDGVYAVDGGRYFFVDRVVGKHEQITYAVGVDDQGAVTQIEILEYRESYGYEVRNADWRAQFVGKTTDSEIKLNRTIANISGATLSCKHLTDGVRRVLMVHRIIKEAGNGR
jgi:Na+-translocating ferredoxin:NAD+ oxidoreductase RnfG subunit